MSTLFSDTATDSISSSRIRDCSSGYKTGGWIGVRHPLRGGWMLANRGLDLVLDLVPGTCCGAAGC
jgi:hypothetical protein